MNTLIYIHKQQLPLHLHRCICNSYDYSNIYKDIYRNISFHYTNIYTQTIVIITLSYTIR